MVDHPGGRKDHGRVVPLVGGVAIFAGFSAAVFGIPPALPAELKWVVLAMATMVLIGVFDDIHELAPRKKLVGQLLVSAVVVIGGNTVIESFGNLFGTGNIHAGPLGTALTIFCLVGLINAMNMIDGLDGLAGGLALISTVALTIAAKVSENSQALTLLTALAGSIVAFMIFNMRFPWQKQARVFLGDAGSNLLGLAVAYFAIVITQQPAALHQDALAPISAVWLAGLPILDTLTVMTRRIAGRQSPFAPGRDHLHHILLGLGFSHAATLWTMLCVSILLAACGLAAWRFRIPDWFMLASAISIVIAYYVWTLGVLGKLSRGQTG